ncbi:MAG TPA: mandelate racemase/muconate lactonizing enzyme family protein [Burkholderiales bacterium]|nr:mandelate racemase/muconate lactonizing enzyme family protein [Burkholderiales bacterium]
MKIANIETIVLRIPYTSGGPSDTEVWGGKAWKTADVLLVKISTDAGVTGWGEAFGYNVIPATRIAIDQILAPMCLGRDALAIENLMQEIQQKLHIFGRSGPVIFGLSGIDIALWDIAGKVARQPLHQLLGGGKPQLTCYASMIRYSDPKVVAANVGRALGEGFRHIKLHEIEVAPTRAARDAAGEDVDIMLDVNCPWTLREALDMAQKLRPLNLRWLEEPVWPPEDHTALAQIRARGGIPIAAGENATTVAQFKHLFDAGAVDFVQPSPAKMGGVSELRKVFALAAAYNVTVMPHSFYDGPAFLAGVHVNAALGHGSMQGLGSMVEWRYFDLQARLYGDQAIPRNGSICVPQLPGLGFDPDPAVIRAYRAD